MTIQADALLGKAHRALESAKLLLEAGDPDGACNRAYYAMFDTARALLVALDEPLPKTHSGLVSSFGLVVVARGIVPKALGMAFNRVQRMREIADYTGEGIAFSDADRALSAAGEMLSAATMFIRNDHES